MTKIDTNFVGQKWQYKPEFSTADTSSISNLYCSTTSTSISASIADEIDKRVKELYRRREIEMTGISFNDLERELHELGLELSTIRHSAGDAGCEIEGYFNPKVYKKYRNRKRTVQPIEPSPKKVIFSGPATTILWKDGTKTTVKCQSEDVWDDDVGIAMCYLKKMLGNKGNFNNIFREAMKVAVVQEMKPTTETAINSSEYISSALESMSDNINQINDFMKGAAEALDKALGGKK